MSLRFLLKLLQFASLCRLFVDAMKPRHAMMNKRQPRRKNNNNCSIKIGLLYDEDEQTENGVDLWFNSVERNGGVNVGGKLIQVDLKKCLSTSADEAEQCTKDFIMEDEVIAIIGHDYSSQAIPAGAIAEANKTPMISISTNPATTEGRPYVFRTSFLDPQQAKGLAKFLSEDEDLKFRKACVMFDTVDPYSSGLAANFKNEWEAIHGNKRSVVSFEGFIPPLTDAETPLKACADTKAELLFLPVFADDLSVIANKARELGLAKTLVGSDGWGFSGLEQCGEACAGSYVSDLFDTEDPNAADFVDLYESTYGILPDASAALNYDSATLLEQALGECGEIRCKNVEADRTCLRDAMAKIMFSGVGGDVTFDENGDPIDKCVPIRFVTDDVMFTFVENICPVEM